ncbi:hypothetical protein Agub_g7996 [Astrephomene gubernaculifera]|uniref:Uncharacterized protein n=1 Tax=Astrephomene gubernaculifera TaxID=47775 RepID=A0AAD3HM35_9CHLO|nr:hypothetical protein Agub_g7996 [Astrephomene gubernaculifera]
MAVHLLNGCLLRAPSYDVATRLAASAATAAPGLLPALVESACEGAPHSLLAFSTLSYLVLSPPVVQRLLSAGLVAVLLGQLRAASSAPLEQQLLVSALGLLVTLVRVDGGARERVAGSRGVAGAVAGVLGRCEGEAVRGPALGLLQELVMTRKGLDQVLKCEALRTALDKMCGSDGDAGGGSGGQRESDAAGQEDNSRQRREGGQRQEQAQPRQQQQRGLQQQARLLRSTIAALAKIMK